MLELFNVVFASSGDVRLASSTELYFSILVVMLLFSDICLLISIV